jgi:hypothetical protein
MTYVELKLLILKNQINFQRATKEKEAPKCGRW